MRKITFLAIALAFIISACKNSVQHNQMNDDIDSTKMDLDTQVEDSSMTKSNIEDDNSKLVESLKVNAEVFRPVNGFYKDAHRKEEILIGIKSDGTREFLFSQTNILNIIYAMPVTISPIEGYEYEVWCVEKGGSKKIFAFNECDLKKSK